MSGDVTIPVETARQIATWLRSADGHTLGAAELHGWADLLDPKPALRDAVAEAICASDNDTFDPSRDYADDYRRNADAALAVVRDHIAALPTPVLFADDYRARILALLDGDAS